MDFLWVAPGFSGDVPRFLGSDPGFLRVFRVSSVFQNVAVFRKYYVRFNADIILFSTRQFRSFFDTSHTVIGVICVHA